MASIVIDKLRELIGTPGQPILHDPKKFTSLMLDACLGNNEREINILAIALINKIPQRLQSSGNKLLTAELQSNLARRLKMDCALEADAALWAVITWAEALGMVVGKHPEMMDTVTPPRKVYLVGIAGRTCSGKDTTVQSIASVNKQVLHINTDIFFDAESSHSCHGYQCWEHEQTLRFNHMVDVISSLKNGNGTVIEDRSPWLGAYDCEINSSDLNEKTIIIVQGFLLFIRKDVYSLFDSRMFIDVSDTKLCGRRLKKHGLHAKGYIQDVILPVSKEYDQRQKDVAERPFFDSDRDSAVDIADKVVSRINSEFSKSGMNNHLVSPITHSAWEVEFGDILSDHEWHPIQFKNLKKWAQQNKGKLDSGEVLNGHAFSYRRNHNGHTDYEVRLRNEWAKYRHIFRYTRAETPPKRDL